MRVRAWCYLTETRGRPPAGDGHLRTCATGPRVTLTPCVHIHLITRQFKVDFMDELGKEFKSEAYASVRKRFGGGEGTWSLELGRVASLRVG